MFHGGVGFRVLCSGRSHLKDKEVRVKRDCPQSNCASSPIPLS